MSQFTKPARLRAGYAGPAALLAAPQIAHARPGAARRLNVGIALEGNLFKARATPLSCSFPLWGKAGMGAAQHARRRTLTTVAQPLTPPLPRGERSKSGRALLLSLLPLQQSPPHHAGRGRRAGGAARL